MDSSRIHQGLLRSTSGSSAGTLPLPSTATGVDEAFLRDVTSAVGRTRAQLLDAQHEDGYWVGELEGDTILESEYILLLAWMGREKSEAAIAAAEYIKRQ
ncbi:MAG: squalene--hopene cyclase, partial [Planctomycetes bacterium]|nr:squalene--hopene cyclase [Planctomycetota bacterium]